MYLDGRDTEARGDAFLHRNGLYFRLASQRLCVTLITVANVKQTATELLLTAKLLLLMQLLSGSLFPLSHPSPIGLIYLAASWRSPAPLACSPLQQLLTLKQLGYIRICVLESSFWMC